MFSSEFSASLKVRLKPLPLPPLLLEMIPQGLLTVYLPELAVPPGGTQYPDHIVAAGEACAAVIGELRGSTSSG